MKIVGLISNLKYKAKLHKMRKAGIKIGNNCFILSSLSQFSSEPYLITIGDNVLISAHCFLCPHDGATWVVNNLNGTKYDRIGPITIGNNVYVGYGTTIFGNVKIGNNVIIGANSVVTRDIPDNFVAVGQPARVICTIDEYITKNMAKFDDTSDFSYTAKKDYYLKKVQNGGKK